MEAIIQNLGIVAIVTISLGAFFGGLGVLVRAFQHSEYFGLREQISDTIANIGNEYAPDEPMSAQACKDILSILNRRFTPRIDEIKCRDEFRLQKEQK